MNAENNITIKVIIAPRNTSRIRKLYKYPNIAKILLSETS